MSFSKGWIWWKFKVSIKNLKFCEGVVESIRDWISKLSVIIGQYMFFLLLLTHSFICQSFSLMLVICHQMSFYLRVRSSSRFTLEWRHSNTVKRANYFINVVTHSSCRCKIYFSERLVFFTQIIQLNF